MEKPSFYIAKALRAILQMPAMRNCVIDRTSKVCSGTQLTNIIMRKYSYIGHDCFVVNAEIGSFCSIADNCRIGGAEHNISFVSTSPVFCRGKNVLRKNFSNLDNAITSKTSIGNDVWLGAGTIVKSGVHISTGAVVGGGSVVTKDIPPYEIWAGNPAKLIRKRFDDRTIDALINSCWWELSDVDIKRVAPFIKDPTAFLAAMKE